MEIEEIKMNEGKYDKEEIKRLEVACRLNYATTKAKLNEYEIVLTQAREVTLKKKKKKKKKIRSSNMVTMEKRFSELAKLCII